MDQSLPENQKLLPHFRIARPSSILIDDHLFKFFQIDLKVVEFDEAQILDHLQVI
jgi:hypothetical protein